MAGVQTLPNMAPAPDRATGVAGDTWEGRPGPVPPQGDTRPLETPVLPNGVAPTVVSRQGGANVAFRKGPKAAGGHVGILGPSPKTRPTTPRPPTPRADPRGMATTKRHVGREVKTFATPRPARAKVRDIEDVVDTREAANDAAPVVGAGVDATPTYVGTARAGLAEVVHAAVDATKVVPATRPAPRPDACPRHRPAAPLLHATSSAVVLVVQVLAAVPDVATLATVARRAAMGGVDVARRLPNPDTTVAPVRPVTPVVRPAGAPVRPPPEAVTMAASAEGTVPRPDLPARADVTATVLAGTLGLRHAVVLALRHPVLGAMVPDLARPTLLHN